MANGSPEFISEPIDPDPGTFNAEFMSTGLASLPAGFTWRGAHYDIVECLDHVKQTSSEGGRAGGEVYLRRQVFTVRLDTGQTAVLYLDRQAKRGAHRWFLYTIQEPDSDA